MCLKEIGLHAKNLFTILGSIANIIGGGGGGRVCVEPMWPSYGLLLEDFKN